MQGLHLTADLHHCRCQPALLLDADMGLAECLRAVQAVAQLVCGFESPSLPPAGYTATVLLAESHVCLHTWPEQRAATLDVYVYVYVHVYVYVYVRNFSADHSAKAQVLMNHLLAVFDAEAVEQQTLQRGSLPVQANAAA